MNLFGHVGLTLAVVYPAHELARRRAWSGKRAGVGRVKDPPTRASTPHGPDAAADRWVDYRLLGVASLLPDFIDKPLGLWLAPGLVNGATRSIGHTAIFALLLLVASLGVWTWQRRSRGYPMFALCSSWHLILDQMWRSPVTVFWPALGWRFPELETTVAGWASSKFAGLLLFYTDPPELAGASVIVLFTIMLWRRRTVRRFIRSGAVA